MKDRKLQKAIQFWDYQARRYPSPFDKDILNKTMQVIEIAKHRGVKISGKQIIDIGCGTGIYTLPLAKEAQFVFGLDISSEMLTRLIAEAKKLKINNIVTLHVSWQEIDLDSNGLKGSFDIAWTSLSPAITHSSDVIKMMHCAKEWCIYVDYGEKRDNPVLENALTAHGLTYRKESPASKFINILESLGKEYTKDVLETSWTWIGTKPELIEDLSKLIEFRGGEPNFETLKNIVDTLGEDHIIKHTTNMEEVVIIWHV